jgi:MYXO-CTERM domain-containing protein
MTVDPEFDFNPDAEAVSHRHRAKATALCDSMDWNQRTVHLELADGRELNTSFSAQPAASGPFARIIEQYQTTGAPLLIVDNTAALAPPPLGGEQGCGCSSGGTSSGLALLFLAAGRMFARARRPRA